MKLVHVKNGHYIDPRIIRGIIWESSIGEDGKPKDRYSINLGENGARFQALFTEKELREILKHTDLEFITSIEENS